MKTIIMKNQGGSSKGSKIHYNGDITKPRFNRKAEQIVTTAQPSKVSSQPTSKVSKVSYTSSFPMNCDIMNALREKKERKNPTVTNLLDVLLQASCAVSFFKDALEERCNTIFAEESKLFQKTNIKEIAKLRLLDIISRKYEHSRNLNLIDFLVKVFATLDELRGASNTIKSIFSICMNNLTKCQSCKSWKSTPLNLGVLHVVDLERFESNIGTDEKSYFKHKQAEVEEMSIQDEQNYVRLLQHPNSKKTLERLLADRYCVQPKENKLCSKCKVKTDHDNLSKLQTLSSGLIVKLPIDWNKAEVPESIDLSNCPAARATYQLRAAVLQVPNSTNRKLGPWMCMEKLVSAQSLSTKSPLLLFYEKEVAVVTKLNKKANPSDIRHQRLHVGLNYFIEKMKPMILKNLVPPFQQLKHENLTINQEREVASRSVASPRRLITNPRGKWECAGPTAPLEAAVRGLFSIRAFAAFLQQHPFTKEQLQTSDFLRHFGTIYSLYLQESTLRNQLESLKKMLDNILHSFITNLHTKCDRTVSMESRNTLPRTDASAQYKLTLERYDNCQQMLHDVFSVLKKNCYISYGSNPWTHSRFLDIPLKIGSNFRARESIVGLEECVQQWKQSNQPTVCYVGSVLIIRLFEEGPNKSQGILVRVPKILNMNKFEIMATSVYHLRAVVYSPERQQSANFIVQEIIDAQEINEFLEKGCNASVLFYEQEEICTAQEKADICLSDKPQSQKNENMTDKNAVQVHGSRPKSRRNRENKEFIYGLQNLGNTCFMNAALNGLYSLPSFRSFSTTQQVQGPLLNALFQFCNTHTREKVQSDLLYVFKEAISEFNDGRQHCANSYIFKLLMLLDTLLPSSPSTTFPQDIFGNKLRQYRKGKCESLHDIFGTLAENLFICTQCSHTRRNFSYFRTVDVPIPYYAKTFDEVTIFSPNNFYPYRFAKEYTGTEVSETEYRQEFRQLLERNKKLLASTSPPTLSRTDLVQCLKYMLRASLMSPQSLMQCDNCGFETQHYKQSFFRQLSTAFVIHFQRFDERNGSKLDTPVDFPMNLDMSDYCVNDQRRYQLCGVAYHFGSLEFGHYTACIKVEERWYDVNDSSVREVRDNPPIENAYLLFYEQYAPTRNKAK